MAKARRNQNTTNATIDSLLARIAALESVPAASYWSSTGSLAVGSGAKINFDSKDYDTHNAVTTGVGVWNFTAPKSGTYLVSGAMNFSASATVVLYKNGSAYKVLGFDTAAVDSSYSGIIYLNQGENIDVRPGGAVNVAGNASQAVSPSNVSICWIGP